jgi:hypothetical protein
MFLYTGEESVLAVPVWRIVMPDVEVGIVSRFVTVFLISVGRRNRGDLAWFS